MGQRDRLPPGTREVAEAMLCDVSLSVVEIARRVGASRHTVHRWKRALDVRNPGRGTRSARMPSLVALDTALRIHVGRQIAQLDARLAREEPGLDPGKTLRDIAGLRRLIDDLAAAPAARLAEALSQGPARAARGHAP